MPVRVPQSEGDPIRLAEGRGEEQEKGDHVREHCVGSSRPVEEVPCPERPFEGDASREAGSRAEGLDVTFAGSM